MRLGIDARELSGKPTGVGGRMPPSYQTMCNGPPFAAPNS